MAVHLIPCPLVAFCHHREWVETAGYDFRDERMHKPFSKLTEVRYRAICASAVANTHSLQVVRSTG